MFRILFVCADILRLGFSFEISKQNHAGRAYTSKGGGEAISPTLKLWTSAFHRAFTGQSPDNVNILMIFRSKFIRNRSIKC